MTLTALRGNNRADDPNCSEWGAVGLMTLIALRGNNRAHDPNCSEEGAIGLMTLIASRGGPTFEKPVQAPLTGVQPRWIQGILRGDGFGDQDTIELKIQRVIK